MDPTLYNAAVEGIIEDADFKLAGVHQRDEENGYQVTPKGNTVLHVAALYGQSGFVGQVLEITSSLLWCKNKKNETALHLAANKGHKNVAGALLHATGEGNKETLMRMTDDDGDTALHKAVRTRWIDTVKLLVKEDPEFEFPANKAGETPLYLAAESGFCDGLSEILKSCNRPTYGGPCSRTALHAAIIHKHRNCSTSLLQWNKSLCEEPDKWDWNPVHYAVKQGLKGVVCEMLGWKKSLAYIPAGSGNDWTTTIHIAASEGYVKMIKELLKHCPDCWDEESRGSNTQQTENKPKINNKSKLEDIMAAAQIHLVVATLLVAVSFTAALTVPGGFESDSPNKGMAILIKKTAFRAFVVSNAIAFTCSSSSVFSYFFIAVNASHTKKLKVIRRLFGVASRLQLVAMSAVVIAFVTGAYATLAQSVGLAVTVCFIGCSVLVCRFLYFCYSLFNYIHIIRVGLFGRRRAFL